MGQTASEMALGWGSPLLPALPGVPGAKPCLVPCQSSAVAVGSFEGRCHCCFSPHPRVQAAAVPPARDSHGNEGQQQHPLPQYPPAPQRGHLLMALPGRGKSLLAHKMPRRALRPYPQHITGPRRSPASLLKPERGRQIGAGPLRAGFGRMRQGSGVPFPVPIYFHSLRSQPGCRLQRGGCSGPGLGERRRCGCHGPPFPGSILGGGDAALGFCSGNFHTRVSRTWC